MLRFLLWYHTYFKLNNGNLYKRVLVVVAERTCQQGSLVLLNSSLLAWPAKSLFTSSFWKKLVTEAATAANASNFLKKLNQPQQFLAKVNRKKFLIKIINRKSFQKLSQPQSFLWLFYYITAQLLRGQFY